MRKSTLLIGAGIATVLAAAGAWALADKAAEPRPVSPFDAPTLAAAPVPDGDAPHGDCCQKGDAGEHHNCPMKGASAGKTAVGEAPAPEATKKCPYLARLGNTKPEG